MHMIVLTVLCCDSLVVLFDEQYFNQAALQKWGTYVLLVSSGPRRRCSAPLRCGMRTPEQEMRVTLRLN